MVYFMCQLDWATMPRYLVRYYAGCFYEGSFGWDSHLNQWTPEWSRLPFIMCVGLNRTQDCPSQRRENSPSRILLDLNCVGFSLGLQPAGPSWRFWTHEPPHGTSQVAQWWRIHLTIQETCIQSLGREDPLEKEMATHSNILAWVILQTEESDELQSTGLQRVGQNLATKQQKQKTLY